MFKTSQQEPCKSIDTIVAKEALYHVHILAHFVWSDEEIKSPSDLFL